MLTYERYKGREQIFDLLLPKHMRGVRKGCWVTFFNQDEECIGTSAIESSLHMDAIQANEIVLKSLISCAKHVAIISSREAENPDLVRIEPKSDSDLSDEYPTTQESDFNKGLCTALSVLGIDLYSHVIFISPYNYTSGFG